MQYQQCRDPASGIAGAAVTVLPAVAGMWYSLSLFYDSRELGPAYATIATATALASVLGGPVAACLLQLNGLAGLHGWQASGPLQTLIVIALQDTTIPGALALLSRSNPI